MMGLLWDYLPLLLSGVLVTVSLVVFSLVFGLSLACLLTYLSFSRKPYITLPIRAFSFLIRGTPFLVQLFIIYYGVSQLSLVRETFLWHIFAEPFSCAVIALSLNTAAYTMILLIGAVKKIPPGEIEAGHAFAMSGWQLWKLIIVPNTLRFVLPAYSNEVVLLIKTSSLASTITLLDILGVTQRIIGETYIAIPFLLFAGVLYLLLNSLSLMVFRVIERRL